jgi:adenine/guanine phosphoribosyltransferase-like PRPP-binding protein
MVAEDLSLDAPGLAVADVALDPLAVEFLAEDVQADGFEAVAGVEAGPASMGGPAGQGIGVGVVVVGHARTICEQKAESSGAVVREGIGDTRPKTICSSPSTRGDAAAAEE